MFGSKKLSDALAMPRSPSHSLHRSTSRHRLVGENVTEIGVCIARDSRLTRSELEEELRAPGTCGLLKNLPKARGRRVRGCFEEANDPGTSPFSLTGANRPDWPGCAIARMNSAWPAAWPLALRLRLPRRRSHRSVSFQCWRRYSSRGSSRGRR